MVSAAEDSSTLDPSACEDVPEPVELPQPAKQSIDAAASVIANNFDLIKNTSNLKYNLIIADCEIFFKGYGKNIIKKGGK